MAKDTKTKSTGNKLSPNKTMAVPECDIDWRASGDCNTLKSAHEIMADSKRHSAAKKHAAKEVKQLAKVTGK